MKDIKLIFERQILHYFLLIILLSGIFIISQTEGFLTGRFLGISSSVWFYLAIVSAILHQIYIWFSWRTQLHYSLITRFLGQNGFFYYSVGFFILLISRPILIICLAISNKDSLHINQLLLNSLAFIIAIPASYLFYSVKKYFGVKRAFGIDHFDKSYRNKPLVREGIFRFVRNGMYVFGFLMLWIPGLLLSSKAALLVALFHHTYVWVHYCCTEKPDMERIYARHSNI